MALSEEQVKKYVRRLLLSRMRILCDHGFYGLLLMHMKFSVDEAHQTAATDGERIIFGANFLDQLDDEELDFILMHEILHVVLQHCFRGEENDQEIFNIACDIVVNSNILLENKMKISSISLRDYGISMHTAPDGKEGYEYTAEQVYDMIYANCRVAAGASGQQADGAGGDTSSGVPDQSPSGMKGKSASGAPGWLASGVKGQSGQWDDHSKWGSLDEDGYMQDVWMTRMENAAKAIEIRDPSSECGMLPLFARRMLGQLRKPKINWRNMLNEFVQEEVVDYSFLPPDHRFDDSPFFLPDFNDKEMVAKNILFMIDTSGSMSDEMVTEAYAEVKGAIDQFGGKLKGWLGFFDAGIVEPKPFEDEEDFRVIKPAGGGGTSFAIIFNYVKKYMEDDLPASIIILTDGYAPFPDVSAADGIPVLWVLNNEMVTPPWGKIARLVDAK